MVLGGAGESTNGAFSRSSSTSLSNSVKLFRGDMRQDNGIGYVSKSSVWEGVINAFAKLYVNCGQLVVYVCVMCWCAY